MLCPFPYVSGIKDFVIFIILGNIHRKETFLVCNTISYFTLTMKKIHKNTQMLLTEKANCSHMQCMKHEKVQKILKMGLFWKICSWLLVTIWWKLVSAPWLKICINLRLKYFLWQLLKFSENLIFLIPSSICTIPDGLMI